MKHLIKIVGLIAVGTASAGDSSRLTTEEAINMEMNAPVGVAINSKGEVVNNGTKAYIDLERPVGGTSIRYMSTAAASMSATGTNEYEYNSPGCRATKNGGDSLSMDEAIHLPLGTKIVSFTAYGVDTSASSNVNALIYRTNINDGVLTLDQNYTSGAAATPGRLYIGDFLDYTLAYSDNLFVRLTVSDNDVTACGFRIGFIPPNVASDSIFVSNFYR